MMTNLPKPVHILQAYAHTKKDPTNKDPTLKSRIVLSHLRQGCTEKNLEWGRWLVGKI